MEPITEPLRVGDKIILAGFRGATIEEVVRVSKYFLWTKMIAITDARGQKVSELDKLDDGDLLRMSRHCVALLTGIVQLAGRPFTIKGVYRRSE